jgi:hypothetical protein
MPKSLSSDHDTPPTSFVLNCCIISRLARTEKLQPVYTASNYPANYCAGSVYFKLLTNKV